MIPLLQVREPVKIASKWPAQPYKGLNYYVEEDAAIFAGRDQDIARCAPLVGATGTRIFILHGTTGCGKSSFLRAGLLPFLERAQRHFAFVRDERRSRYFVRSTDDPFGCLVEAVFGLSQKPRTLESELGPVTVDLSRCLDPPNLQTFLQEGSPAKLVQALSCIAGQMPETLVWVIDQVEEMLTLKPGKQGEIARDRFIEFLRQFTTHRWI